MQAIVTGAAGFIGSHLVDRLVVDGHDVVAVDDLSRGRIENLERSIPSGRVAFVYADLRETGLHEILGAVDRRLRDRPFATIYHLATRTDAVSDAALIDAARTLGSKVVFISSPTDGSSQHTRALARDLGVRTSTVVVERCYGPRMRLDDATDRAQPFDVQLVSHAVNPRTESHSGSRLSYVADVVTALVRAARHDGEGADLLAVSSHEQADVVSIAADVARASQGQSEAVSAGRTAESPSDLRRGIGATYAWYASSVRQAS